MRSPTRALRIFAPLLLVATLGLSGCSNGGSVGAGSGDGGTVAAGDPIAAPGRVSGQGTVIQSWDAEPLLCLGAVAESHPPQCTGPEIVGWDWEAVDLEESVEDVTWGNYAVAGTWDGTRFTLTDEAIPLALYDPLPFEPDPRTDPANAGDNPEATLLSIQEDLTAGMNDDTIPWPILGSWPENGYLFVTVNYDDGTIQAYYDGLYGPDTVAIQSALRDLP